MLVDAQHDGIDVLTHDACKIGDALARAHADVFAALEDAGPAELSHRCLEADARAQRWFLEDHAEDAARQDRHVFAALPRFLEANCLVQQVVNLVLRSNPRCQSDDAWLLPD